MVDKMQLCCITGLLTFAMVMNSLVVKTTGFQYFKTDEIEGGTEAVPHSLPWLVEIYRYNNQSCAGSLISDEWILTAGHCCTQYPAPPSAYKVKLGAHWLGTGSGINPFESSQQVRGVKKIFPHPQYSSITKTSDACLMKLVSKVLLTKYVSPVCLPTKHRLRDGHVVVASGWGFTTHDLNLSSPYLKQITVNTVNQEQCRESVRKRLRIYVDETMICTVAPGGADGTCSGDSGSPLVTNVTGRWVIHGINSFSNDCDTAGFDVFTWVPCFLDWIKEITGIIPPGPFH